MAGNMALDRGVSDVHLELMRAFVKARWRGDENVPGDPLWAEVKVLELKYLETMAKFIDPQQTVSAYVISSLTRQLEMKGLYWGRPRYYPSSLLEAVGLPAYNNPMLFMGKSCPDGLYLPSDSVECYNPWDTLQQELKTVAYWRLIFQTNVSESSRPSTPSSVANQTDQLQWSGPDKPTDNTLHPALNAQSCSMDNPHIEPTTRERVQWGSAASLVDRRCHDNQRRLRNRRRYAAREIYGEEMRHFSQPGNGCALVLAIKYQRLTTLGLCVRRLRSQLLCCQASIRPWKFVKKLGKKQDSLKYRLLKRQ